METKRLIKKILKKYQQKDFWNSLSPNVKERINQGLVDVDAGRYTSAKSVIDRLISE